MQRRRKTLFILMTASIVWISCELIVAVALPTVHPPISSINPRAFIEKYRTSIEKLIEGRTDFVAFDPDLGWSHKPWGQGGIFRANGQTMRADHDYTFDPAPALVRVATFGDSFMLGSDVEVEFTWQALLEKYDPPLEVLNFGVSSYGTDQAVLRYEKDGRAFSPDIVVLSFITENSRRNLTTFRPFYLSSTGLPLAKPRFRMDDGRMVLVENPVQSLDQYQDLLDHPETELPRIGRWDDYYSQYEPSMTPWIDNFPSVKASRFWMNRMKKWWNHRLNPSGISDDWYSGEHGTNSLLVNIFDRFHDDAIADGAVPVFLLFPIHFDYRNIGPSGEMSYSNLLPFFEARGYHYIDCDKIFRPALDSGHSYGDLFAFGEDGGHYSAFAHELIASAMGSTIENLRQELHREALMETETINPPARSPAKTHDGESRD